MGLARTVLLLVFTDGNHGQRQRTHCRCRSGTDRFTHSRASIAEQGGRLQAKDPLWFQLLLSTNSVTGPSLTSATCMWARKRPVATRMPLRWTARTKCSYRRSASSRARRVHETGTSSLAAVAPQRELAHHQHLTTDLANARFIFPWSSSKIRSVHQLVGQVIGIRLRVLLSHTEQHHQSPLNPPDDFARRP